MVHISLLKDWKTANLQEEQPVSLDDVPDVEEPYYEIERILRWRKIKRNKKIFKEYLVLCRRFPIEEATWICAEQFSHPQQLKAYLDEDTPTEEKV